MKRLFISVLLSLPLLALGQTTTENYVKSTTYQEGFIKAQIDANSIPTDQRLESVTYYDGLGRPKQSISQRAGGNREDLMTPILYDVVGRQPKDYLPYPNPDLTNDGEYIDGVTAPLLTYYYDNYVNARVPAMNAYSHKRFEASPLNRVLETGAPGKDWKIDPTADTDHTIKMEYLANEASEVHHFSAIFNTTTEVYDLVYDGFYLANELYKTVTKDENWTSGNDKTIQEFKNRLGQIVLKRTFNAGAKHDTHYIYDSYGNLTFVFSPEASQKIMVLNNQTWELVSNSETILDDLGYRYKYDYRSRLTEKKVPGKDWEYILYDNLDRPILAQDANLRADNNKWLFTKYDALGRVVYTGIVTDPPARGVMEQNLRTPSTVSEKRVPVGVVIGDVTLYYTNYAFPTQDIEVLTVNYYDDYIDHSGVNKPQVVLGANTTEHPNVPTTPKGLPTVSKVRVLGTTDWITTLTAYDKKGRVLYVDSKNVYLDTRDVISSKLDFTGKVLESQTSHLKPGNATISTKDYFHYDHLGRLLTHKQKIDSEPLQLIAENHYDELGQLIKKNVGGQTLLDGYTDITNADVTFDGTITKDETTNAWNSYVKTKGEIPSGEDGGISAIMVQDNKRLRVGLLKSSTSALLGVEYFDYGMYTEYSNGQNFIKIVVGGTGSSGNYGTYAIGDELIVERVGSEVRFYKNTSLLKTETGVGNDPLNGKVAFYDPNGSIEDLNLFGAALDNKLQYVDYAYNIRGWLTDINDVGGTGNDRVSDLFGFKINYNLPVEGQSATQGVVSLYNGNISQTVWKTLNSETIKRSYGYKYDALNRITGADSRKNTDLNTADIHSVSTIAYDKNGNIETLKRMGAGGGDNIWDDLVYSYDPNSNQLITVVDNASSSVKDEGFKDATNLDEDFDYDDNGNMTKDLNKGISLITYNHLNLPEVVTINNGNESGTITYVYDATGIKLKKTLQSGTNADIHTEYAGNYVYSDMASVGSMQMQFFNHPEGYVEPTPVGSTKSVKGFDTGSGQTTYSTYQYIFQYTDHLGNVRLSYADSDLNGAITDGEIIEESNYYPFGLKQKGYNNVVSSNGNSLAQQWKFGGKEYNEELGLNWYDISARNYDPAIGRWMNLDPLAEAMRRHSPYNYAFDNPIYFMDPDGMVPVESGGGGGGSSGGESSGGGVSSGNSGGFGEVGSGLGGSEFDDRMSAKNFDDGSRGYSHEAGGRNTDPPAANEGNPIQLDEVVIKSKKSSGNDGGNSEYASDNSINKSGFISVGYNMALGGGYGFEIGIARDDTGNHGLFINFSVTAGLGLDVGYDTGDFNSTNGEPFLLSNMQGTSATYNIGVSTPVGGVGYNYSGSLNEGIYGVEMLNPNNFGRGEDGYTSGSASVSLQPAQAKVSVSGMFKKTKTVLWDF